MKSLQALAEVRPEATFLKVDLKTAFQTMDRGQAFRAMAAADAETGACLAKWYGQPATHLWKNAAGNFAEVTSDRGFDQGCPLAPAGFAVGQRQPLEAFLAQLQQLDPDAKLYSYLDDAYVVVKADLAALTGVASVLQPLGLALNPTKTQAWCPSGRAMVAPELQCYYTDSLPVLGSQLKAPGDTDEAPHRLGQGGSGLAEATQRLDKLLNNLRPLVTAGLKRQAAGALFKAYAGPASQHVLQMAHATEEEAKAYDDKLRSVWQTLLERTLDDRATLRLGLPTRLSGAGLQWAETRRHAAFWSGWTAAATEVKTDSGLETLADLLDKLPGTAAKLAAAREGLAAQGSPASYGASLADALDVHLKQRVFIAVAQKKTHAAHLQRLPTASKACFLAAGGPGAGAFLQYPEDANCSMEDALWCTAVRQRLGCARAEYNEQQYQHAAPHCCLKTHAGILCNSGLDANGLHCTTCQSGGGVMRRHARLAYANAGLVKRWTQQEPLMEQRVPAWDRDRPASSTAADPVERAILDVEYTATNERHWVDVSVRHPAAGSLSEVCRAAKRAGEAARRGERAKHIRYPGPQLTAFVVEVGGRLGGEARQWLRRQVQELPPDRWPSELAYGYKAVSCAVQSHTARQLRAASGLKYFFNGTL